MNYEIIKDEKALMDFIEWLPDLNEYETYYVCLFARNKYLKDLVGNNLIPHIKSDKQQLKRFTSHKKDLFKKIAQLECPIGSYMQKDTPIPQEALALYISVNPRSMYKAIYGSIKKLTDCLQNSNLNVNPHQEVMSEIQRSKSRTVYVDFDLDNKSNLAGLKSYIKGTVNEEAVTLIETRGGYHILIEPSKVDLPYKNTWHQNLSKLEGVDQIGDCMIPVLGCAQGQFIPKFVNFK